MIKNKKDVKPIIDLTSSEGNAFQLLAHVNQIGAQIGLDEDEITKIKNEMKSADYEHLINVFDRNFGEFIDLIR